MALPVAGPGLRMPVHLALAHVCVLLELLLLVPQMLLQGRFGAHCEARGAALAQAPPVLLQRAPAPWRQSAAPRLQTGSAANVSTARIICCAQHSILHTTKLQPSTAHQFPARRRVLAVAPPARHRRRRE